MTDQPDPLYVDFHLFDRQIVDSDGLMVGNVDDIELAAHPDGRYQVTALLVGQQVLGDRLGGRLGGWMSALARRLSPEVDPPPIRVPYDLVDRVGSEITLRISRDLLVEPQLEGWLRSHLIDRIPGADHAGQ